eukprot:Nitzschia sp. Nitz4//scaffold240_size29840//12430//15293//NITZ4_008018-RA/size29840-augustus-gene-0.27-mRNA-1//1//CDS//3329543750//6696//frame0
MSDHYHRNKSNQYRNNRGWDRPSQRGRGRGRGRGQGGWGGRPTWQDRGGGRSFQHHDRREAEQRLPWERRPDRDRNRPQESPFPFAGNVNSELDQSRRSDAPAQQNVLRSTDNDVTMADITLPPPPIDAPTEDHRHETLDRLSKLRPGEERFQEYAKLPQHERLVLCLREDVSYGALPIQDFPDDWSDRVSRAIDSTKSVVTDFYKKRSRDVYEEASEPESSDVSSADDMYSTKAVHQSEIRRATFFVSSLKYCPELTLGFMAPMVTGQYNTSWCYCPCGSAMKTWRKFAGVEAFLHDKQCDYKGKKRPFELLRHVQAKATAGCLAHQLIEHYLNQVFENFYGPGYRHIAFANVDDPEYRRIERYLLKKTDKLIEGLRQEQRKMRDLERRLQQSDRAQAELKKYNEDLANKLRAEQQLKEQFKAKSEAIQTPEQEQDVKEQTQEFRKYSLKLMHNTKPPSDLKINWTPATFDISEAMDEWYDRYYSRDIIPNDAAFPYLFAEEGDDVRSSWSRQQINAVIVAKWNVVSHHEEEALKKYDEEERAEDGGGPTREFFNTIWNQMPSLNIEGVELFQRSNGGLVPVKSDFFVGKKNQECSTWLVSGNQLLILVFYVADLLSSDVLELFRGLDPSSPTYFSGPLIEDLMDIMDMENKNQDPKKRLLRRLELKESEGDETLLRQKAKEVYFEDSSLSSIEEGITLGGKYGIEIIERSHSDLLTHFLLLQTGFLPLFACFRLVPTKLISKIAFASQRITYDMVFDAHGAFRFIHFAQDKYEPEESELFCENQADFWPRFTDWFKRKLHDDSKFIASFFHLVTGMSYIPDVAYNKDFNIKIEYNASEMGGGNSDLLPVIHTCDNTMKLPANAYNGDIEVFERMLQQTMKYASGDFDMK